jgi:hypothetical protein
VEEIFDLNVIDQSLFMRLAPVVEYVDTVNFNDPALYFGHGAMSNTLVYTDLFTDWLAEDVIFEPSFLPGFPYDYGIVGALLVALFAVRLSIERLFSLQTLVFVALIFNASFNTLLFWFVIVTFAWTKTYRTESELGAQRHE